MCHKHLGAYRGLMKQSRTPGRKWDRRRLSGGRAPARSEQNEFRWQPFLGSVFRAERPSLWVHSTMALATTPPPPTTPSFCQCGNERYDTIRLQKRYFSAWAALCGLIIRVSEWLGREILFLTALSLPISETGLYQGKKGKSDKV